MTFTPKDWRDYPDTTTPITQAALEDLETRVTDYAEAILPVHTFQEFSDLSWTSGTADVTDAINDALVSLKSTYAYGALLQLPSGLAVISDTIVLPLGCGIRGHGMFATRLTLANGSNCDMVQNYQSSDQVEANGMFTSVRDMSLYGNADNQTSGSGIGWNLNPQWSNATNDPDWDCHQLVENVWLFEMKEAGAWADARSESRYVNCVARYCQGNGFEVGTDTFYVNCSAGGNGLAGFYIGGYGFYLAQCKAFYSGEVTAASGHGFVLASGCKAGVLSACQAQDNKGYGVYMDYALGCRVDVSVHANGRDSSGSRPDGVRIVNSYGNLVDIMSNAGHDGNTQSQNHAVSLWTGSSGNRIRVVHMGLDSYDAADVVNPSSDALAGNTIDVGGMTSRGAVEVTASSGTAVTPYPTWGGGVQDITLTAGTVTINGPGEAAIPGAGLTFILRQDGTGLRSVTFGTAAYRVHNGDFAMGTAANNVETISFVFDGTYWLETGRAATLGTD